ncbi:MAG: tetratricopeptide repeat protein [Treponema sp.]|nr:tetratricopeptide repeat protein [Treponema sp.]
MNPLVIVIISILAVVISSLSFLIIKNFLMPKKVDNIPKLLKQGRTQNAIKLAKQIIAKDSKNYTAHYYLGKAYAKDNKFELANLEYKIVNDYALFGNGINEIEFRKEYNQLLMRFHQYKEALNNNLLLTKMEPNNAEHYYNTGTLYEKNNKNDVALGYMKKAIQLNPRHAKAHAETGLLLYKLKNYPEAKKEIDTAIKLSPETYSSYYYLGKIQKEGKDMVSAIKAFERAQKDPEFKLKAIIEHGSCYMMGNRYDNAIVDFQRAIELDKDGTNPETLYARYFLATCFEKMRKLDKAIEQWEIIYKKNKGFRDVSAKLSEYKDLESNDSMKDYLTCSNEEFINFCKKVIENNQKLQVVTCDAQKWGCQITAIDKKEDWMAVRKQVTLHRFYREPEPLDEKIVQMGIDSLKNLNSVKVFLYSSSGFSPVAKRYAENRPAELFDKPKLEALLSN